MNDKLYKEIEKLKYTIAEKDIHISQNLNAVLVRDAENKYLELENFSFRKALGKIAEQHTTEEAEEEGDLEYGYNTIIEIAREVLDKFKAAKDN